MIDYQAVKWILVWMLGGGLFAIIVSALDLFLTYLKVKDIVATFDDFTNEWDEVMNDVMDIPDELYKKLSNVITNLILWPKIILNSRTCLAIVEYELKRLNEELS